MIKKIIAAICLVSVIGAGGIALASETSVVGTVSQKHIILTVNTNAFDWGTQEFRSADPADPGTWISTDASYGINVNQPLSLTNAGTVPIEVLFSAPISTNDAGAGDLWNRNGGEVLNTFVYGFQTSEHVAGAFNIAEVYETVLSSVGVGLTENYGLRLKMPREGSEIGNMDVDFITNILAVEAI